MIHCVEVGVSPRKDHSCAQVRCVQLESPDWFGSEVELRNLAGFNVIKGSEMTCQLKHNQHQRQF